MTVSIITSTGAKIALAQHLSTKKSAAEKESSTFNWPPSNPQLGTQSAKILDLLWHGKVLTNELAAKEYQIYHLPQIARHLRHYHGWPIKMRLKPVINAHGQLSKHGEYFLLLNKLK